MKDRTPAPSLRNRNMGITGSDAAPHSSTASAASPEAAARSFPQSPRVFEPGRAPQSATEASNTASAPFEDGARKARSNVDEAGALAYG